MGLPLYRPAVAADLDQLYEIRFSVLENREDDPSVIPPPRVLAVLREGGSFVCECDGGPVGFSMASAGGREPNLFGLFIRPSYERRGIGRALLALAEAWLRSQDVGLAVLTTGPDTRAEGFYRAAGWQPGEIDAHGERRFTRRLVRSGPS